MVTHPKLWTWLTLLMSATAVTILIFGVSSCRRGLEGPGLSWLEPMPPKAIFGEWRQLANVTYVEVPQPGLQRAIEMLRYRGFAKLTKDDVSTLGISPQCEQDGENYYLIRGVGCVGWPHNWEVESKDRFVWVRQVVMTHSSPRSVEKVPLVICLRFEPAEVFVTVDVTS
jgi:hypothetical protein